MTLNNSEYKKHISNINQSLRMLYLNIADRYIQSFINKYNKKDTQTTLVETINFIVNSLGTDDKSFIVNPLGTDDKITDQFITILDTILKSNLELFDLFRSKVDSLAITCDSRHSISALETLINKYSVKIKIESFD